MDRELAQTKVSVDPIPIILFSPMEMTLLRRPFIGPPVLPSCSGAVVVVAGTDGQLARIQATCCRTSQVS